MPVPATSGNFPDILDSRFAKIYDETYKQLPDRIPELYSVKSGAEFPTKDTARFSTIGAFGDIPEFTGTIVYDDVSQGYDVTFTHKHYASGFQVERVLFEDELFGIMDAKPSGLARAIQRTRQKHGASPFINAFNLDTTWINHTEGVALCSNSHTTTSGASTSAGFDNLSTTAFSATALASARIQMRGFRGDRAERISVMPDLILHPPDIYDIVFEVTQSAGKAGVATNEANVHRGVYRNIDWEYLTDANDWFLIDSQMMKDMLIWIDRVPAEFAMVEDFDTLIGKWRIRCRYSLGHTDWRWILGSQVS